MRNLTIIVAMLATQAAAQQGMKETDQTFEQAELTALLVDHAVEFFDGSVSRYRGDGAYSYKYQENDRPWLGIWRVNTDSQVCVAFDNGSSRCDTFVSDGTRMVLVIENGMRFPVRDRRELVDGN